MTARLLRILAESLERDFMTTEDRKAWVTALRGDAKSLEWRQAESAALTARTERPRSRLTNKQGAKG